MSRLEDVIRRGTRVAQPAANTVAVGVLYFVTGENVLERSNGTAWETYSNYNSSSFSSGMSLFRDYPEEPNEPLIIAGAMGLVGSTGAAGIAGFRGAPGIDGEDGETILIPGIQGAAGPAGAAGGGGNVVGVSVSIAQAAFESAQSSPVTLVAAPGANKVIIPLGWWPEVNLVTVYANNPTWSLQYNGVAIDIGYTYTLTLNSTTGGKLMTGWNNNPANNYMIYATNDPRNKALTLKANANLSGAGSATAKVHLLYFVGDTF